MFNKLLAIDPSLTCTGWALFDVKSGTILGIGKIKSKKEGILSERLSDFQVKASILLDSLKLSKNDILLCEEATTIIDPRATIVVEQVRCIFEVLGRNQNVNVPGRINPRTVQYEIMGLKGSQIDRDCVKAIARETVKSLYAKMLKNIGFSLEKISSKGNQDIIDAILIGALGLARIHSAINAKCDLSTLFTSNYKRRR